MGDDEMIKYKNITSEDSFSAVSMPIVALEGSFCNLQRFSSFFCWDLPDLRIFASLRAHFFSRILNMFMPDFWHMLAKSFPKYCLDLPKFSQIAADFWQISPTCWQCSYISCVLPFYVVSNIWFLSMLRCRICWCFHFSILSNLF